jgi:hypothetical protein
MKGKNDRSSESENHHQINSPQSKGNGFDQDRMQHSKDRFLRVHASRDDVDGSQTAKRRNSDIKNLYIVGWAA